MPSKAEPYGNYTVHAEINTLEIEFSIEATRQQKTVKKNNPCHWEQRKISVQHCYIERSCKAKNFVVTAQTTALCFLNLYMMFQSGLHLVIRASEKTS